MPGSQFLGAPALQISNRVDRTDPGTSLVQVHRGLQPHFDLPQDFSRQGSDPFGQLCTVQCGHLVAQGKAFLLETAGAGRNLDTVGPLLPCDAAVAIGAMIIDFEPGV